MLTMFGEEVHKYLHLFGLKDMKQSNLSLPLPVARPSYFTRSHKPIIKSNRTVFAQRNAFSNPR